MTRNSPRISANKLGEYLIANPVRRRAIIKDQKNPSGAVVPRYKKAFPILEKYFASGDPEVIHTGAQRLYKRVPKSEWEADDNANTALALETFLEVADQLELSDCIVKRAPESEVPQLRIGGIDVSVRPDFYVHTTRRKKKLIGALKFHWTKSDSMELTDSGGAYVATTLHQFLDLHAPKGENPVHGLCYSIDVFRQAAYPAPSGYKRLRDHISAACEEIALRWDSL